MYETFFLVCAIVGGTLLLCQFLMSLIGFGDHHDACGDHDFHDAGGHDAHGDHADHGDQAGHHTWFVGVLTFRSIVAAITFFGLGGLTATVNFHQDPPQAIA